MREHTHNITTLNYSKPYSSNHSNNLKAKRVGKKNTNTR